MVIRLPFLLLFIALGLSGCFGSSSSSGGGSPSTPGNGGTAQLERLEIAPAAVRLSPEQTEQMSATAVYSDGSSEDVTADSEWTVDDTTLAEFDSTTSGLLFALAAGESTITAEFQGLTGSVELIIDQDLISELQLDVQRLELPAGTSQQLTATGVYADGSTENVTDQASWTVADESVAAFDADIAGLLRAIQAGETAILVEYQGLRVAADVEVLSVDLTVLKVEPAGPVELFEGGRKQLRAFATFADLDGSLDVSRDAQWSSDNETVATVRSGGEDAGLVEGASPGSTIIRVTYGQAGSGSTEKTVPIDVEVKAVAAGTTLSIDVPSAIDQGAVVQFTARLVDGAESDNVTGQVQWSSSDDAVLRFLDSGNRPGVAAGFSPGNVQVTASLGDISETKFVDVNEAPGAPRRLTLTATPNAILADNTDTAELEALVRANQDGVALSPDKVVKFVVRSGQTNIHESQAETTEGRAAVNFSSGNVGFYLVEARVEGTLAEGSIPIAVVAEFGQVIARSTSIIQPPNLSEPAVQVVLYNLSNRRFSIDEIDWFQGSTLIGTTSGDDLLDNSLPGNGFANIVLGAVRPNSRIVVTMLDERTGNNFPVTVSLPVE